MKYITEEIKRSTIVVGIVFLIGALLFYIFFSMSKTMHLVSNSINHIIEFPASVKPEKAEPLIIDLMLVPEPTKGSPDDALEDLEMVLSDTSITKDKKILLIVNLQWIFQELLEEENAVSTLRKITQNRNVEVFLIHPSSGKGFEHFLKGYNKIPEELKIRICKWNYEINRKDNVSFPIFLRNLYQKEHLAQKIQDFFHHQIIQKDSLTLITNLTPTPYKVIFLSDPVKKNYIPNKITTLKSMLKSSPQKNVVIIYFPWTYDPPTVSNLHLSEIVALSIWEIFHPVEPKPLGISFDIAIILLFSGLVAVTRKRLSNLGFIFATAIIIGVMAILYIKRFIPIYYYSPNIFELGGALWTGYFFVLFMESHLFNSVAKLIKKFVMRSATYAYIGPGLSKPFYSSLKKLIPGIIGFKVEYRKRLIKKIQYLEGISPENVRILENTIPFTVKRRLGFLTWVKLTVYFELAYFPSRQEREYIESVWKDPVFVPPVFDKLYSRKELQKKALNIYDADSYTKALVYESIGFRYLVDSMDTAAAMFCSNGVLLYCNRKFSKLLGIRSPQPQSTIFDIFSGTFLEEILPALKNAIIFDWPLMDKEIVRKNRAYKVYFTRLSSKSSDNIHLYMMTVVDLSNVYKMYHEEKILRKNTVNMIVHELNNALSPISSNIIYLKKLGDERNGIYRERINKLDAWVKTLNEYIGKLQKFLTQESNKVTLKVFDLSEVVNKAVRFVESIYKYRPRLWKNAEIEICVPGGFKVKSNEAAIGIIIKNLIENAVKYGNGKIRVSARREDGKVIIEVEDNGPGLPPDKLQEIWEPFTKIQPLDEERGKIPGLGLGLYLVKMAAKFINGEISADKSERLGGAKFTLIVKEEDDDTK